MESLNWDLSFEKSLYDIRKLESKLKSEMKSMKVFEKSEIFIDIIRRQSIFILFLWFRNIFGRIVAFAFKYLRLVYLRICMRNS